MAAEHIVCCTVSKSVGFNLSYLKSKGYIGTNVRQVGKSFTHFWCDLIGEPDNNIQVVL